MDRKKIITKLELLENTIHVEVLAHNIGENSEYAFYLYYYPNQSSSKMLISTTKYIKQKKYSFVIDKNGYYFVKCFVQNSQGRYNQDTNTVLYLNKEFRDEFSKLISMDLKSNNTINEPINFFKVPYPNRNFLLISYKNKDKNKCIVENSYNRMKQWCNKYNFDITVLPKKLSWNTTNIIICDKEELKKQYVFSGYAWDDSKFYFGSEDIKSHKDIKKIQNSIGVFTLLDITPSYLYITTDYFSYGKIYYFLNDDMLIAANSYHMLLIILSKLDLKYELDKEFIYTIFASNVTLFRQPINERMAIKNTYQMNLCDSLVIDKKGWHFVKKDSYYVLKGNGNFNEQEYNSLIKKGAQEILSNIRAVLNHPNFQDYVLELSGGKDSRVTFAALTNIENANKKVNLYSIEHEPNDLDIAIGLSNLFNYKYYSGGDIWYQDDVLEYIKRKRSSFCGIRYLWYIESKHSCNLKKMVFNGECFESLAVRYYSHTIKNYDFDRNDYNALVEIYSTLLSKQAIIDYNSIDKLVKNQLLEGLCSIPSSTALEAFDNMFMFYRAGITAGNLDRMYYTCATCMPLQSKALLKAKKMWINNFDDEKIIYDITYMLNPIIASVPYNTSRYNNTRKQIFSKLLFEDIRFKECEITINKDRSKWELAQEENLKNSKFIKSSSWQERGSIPDLVYENCLFALQRLSMYDNGIFRETLCLPIYYYIVNEKNNDVEVRLIHNKLNSVLDCIDAIEGKSE